MYALPFIIAGVWAHGDFIHMNPKTNGGIVMLGRSDGTLNPNGVRFGSAEIYNIVEHFSEIADSLCVSINKAEIVSVCSNVPTYEHAYSGLMGILTFYTFVSHSNHSIIF